MITKTKQLLLISSAILASMSITIVGHAANLTASSTAPTILFDDTSTAADGTEWAISGYDEFFGIYNDVSNHHVVKIDPANSINSFIVDSSGDINLGDGSVFVDKSANIMGIGTTTPGMGSGILSSWDTKLHLKSTTGNSGLVQENNGSTWMRWNGGSAAFISRLNPRADVVKLYNTAPNNSITADSIGVGIGISAPQAKLDVVGDIKASFTGDNTTSGLVELFKMSVNNTFAGEFSDAGFAMENARAGFSWAFRTLENTGGFAASKQGTGAKEFEVRNPTTVASNVELHLANGASNVGGQWLNASSRSYKENINELSGEDAMQALKGLQSVTYQFKRDNSKQQRVGFIAEDVPALLATKDKKTVDPLQIIAVLTKALQVQEKSLQETKADVKAKDARIADMEEKLSAFDLFKQRLDKIEASIRP